MGRSHVTLMPGEWQLITANLPKGDACFIDIDARCTVQVLQRKEGKCTLWNGTQLLQTRNVSQIKDICLWRHKSRKYP